MTQEPKLWRDMTPEEKGALLLAKHEGKQIEWNSTGIPKGEWLEWEDCDDDCLWDETHFGIGFAYRIKPEPKRETVTLTSWGTLNQWLRDGDLSKVHKDNRKCKITFDVIDGKPDPASIKIEEL